MGDLSLPLFSVDSGLGDRNLPFFGDDDDDVDDGDDDDDAAGFRGSSLIPCRLPRVPSDTPQALAAPLLSPAGFRGSSPDTLQATAGPP